MHYGQDVKLTLEVSINANSGKFLTLSKGQGVILGKNDLTTISLMIYCTNDKVKNEFAV